MFLLLFFFRRRHWGPPPWCGPRERYEREEKNYYIDKIRRLEREIENLREKEFSDSTSDSDVEEKIKRLERELESLKSQKKEE